MGQSTLIYRGYKWNIRDIKNHKMSDWPWLGTCSKYGKLVEQTKSKLIDLIKVCIDDQIRREKKR